MAIEPRASPRARGPNYGAHGPSCPPALQGKAPMSDPYQVLGLPADSDDEAIRRRYLELVRQFPPERHPERFAAVRQAYESLRDLNTRLRHRLFEAGRNDSVDAIIEELSCRTTRRRLSLESLLSTTGKKP